MSFEFIVKELRNNFACPYCKGIFTRYNANVYLHGNDELHCKKYFNYVIKPTCIIFFSDNTILNSLRIYYDETNFNCASNIFKYVDMMDFYQ